MATNLMILSSRSEISDANTRIHEDAIKYNGVIKKTYYTAEPPTHAPPTPTGLQDV